MKELTRSYIHNKELQMETYFKLLSDTKVKNDPAVKFPQATNRSFKPILKFSFDGNHNLTVIILIIKIVSGTIILCTN